MTFSNRREPSFDGAHSPVHSPMPAPSPGAAHAAPHLGIGEAAAHQAGRASGLTRVVSTMQIVGSLLAVPLGLASGYSMYRANFSPETTCQALRGNIIAMLDKSVDASTRRMLVRRDIGAFEESCGAVDPDAHAAFKALLALPPAPVTAAVAPAPAPKLRAALPATEVVRKIETKPEIKPEPKAEAKIESKTEPKAEPKIEPRPAVAEKPPVTAPAAEAVQRDANLSDTRWLAAVRQAIVAHQPAKADDADEAAPVAAAKIEPVKVAPAKIEPAKVEPRLDQVLAKPAASPHTDTVAVSRPSPVPAAPPVQLQPTWNVTGQPATSTPVTEAPAAVTTARDDHPVPPASIPVSAPGNGEARPSGQSRIGSWIAEIPLVGRVIEPRGN